MRSRNSYEKTKGRVYTLVLAALVLTGCSIDTAKQPSVRIGDPAPGFTVELLSGGKVSLDDFKGRPLVVTFMAEWCPCSNDSAPVFKEAYRLYHPKGVEFLMFGFQDSRSKFKKFVEEQGFSFPAAYDSGDSIGHSFGVNAPPTTFFITPDGRIKNAYYGKIDELDKLTTWIEEIVADGGGEGPAPAAGA